jgi:acyl-CoA synthetase (AMP-forming)/AMP-acid ligase II
MAVVPSMLTVNWMLRVNARKYPTKVAVTDATRRLTFGELERRVNRVANAVMGLGLGKGDKVAVLMRNQIEWAELLFGFARAGVICVPVNFRFVGREIQYVVEHSEARAIVCGQALAERLDGVRDQLREIPEDRYVLVGAGGRAGYRGYEAWLGAASEQDPGVDVEDGDCWYLGYTSGTTGFPKGTIISQRCRTLGACYTAIEYGIGDEDTNLIVMPLFHSNAIFFQMMQLSVGGSVYIMEEFDPEQALRVIQEQRITNASLVPTMYAMMLGLPAAVKARYSVDSLRVLISSSSPLLTKTKEEIVEFFRRGALHEFYGSTEAGVVTNLKPRDQLRKVRCVGQPFFGTEVRLVKPDGEDAAPGEVGELYSRGITHAYDGYYKNPTATLEAFRDGGWFTAGDLAYQDDEGYVYLVDRKKDMIISGGENIYPTELEEVLVRHPAIEEVAVVGTPDAVWGERVCAVVRLREGASATDTELVDWCRGKLADYKRPRAVVFWPELPKNPTGKILRRVIRERMWAGQERGI